MSSKHIGERYGYLTVIDSISVKEPYRQVYYICQCDCGNIKRIQKNNVLTGRIKSCGCKRLELLGEAASKEDKLSDHRLFSVWNGMRQRCYNPKVDSYKNYGGRGISICDEWRHDFLTFEKWAYENGYVPDVGLSIDRIDVNGNYEPANCRWADAKTQRENQRPKEGKYVVDGVRGFKKDFAEKYGISVAALKYRTDVRGMTFEEAVKAKKQTEGNHDPILAQRLRQKKATL